MTLQTAKQELKSKSLPAAFIPAGRNQVVAVNCNEPEMWRVYDVMVKHGYRRVETFYGVDTDYQMIFKRAK